MKFSLVIPTVDRARELERLLESLQAQTLSDFELIVVDQNPDDRVAEILQRCGQGLAIHHIHSQRGASRAKNVGLALATAEIVAFPDDDCWYPPPLLERVWNILSTHNKWDGISTRGVDERGRLSVNRIDGIGGRVGRVNALRRGTACCLFIRRAVTDRIGGFDETIGAGTRWAGTEDIDWLHRAARAGNHIRFVPGIYVGHPQVINGFGPGAKAKEYRYAMGMGRLLRKNEFPLAFVTLMAAAEIKELGLAAIRGRYGEIPFHTGSFIGIWRGWLGV